MGESPLDVERWHQIEQIFSQVADLGEDRCDSVLSELCGADRQLYKEVKSLLQADRTEHPLLDGVAVEKFDAILPRVSEGQTVGNYKLVREIGVGGMGTVYLANRSDGEFDQEVAVKMIHPAVLSEVALKRFRTERQILARLKHPNIAQLFDGGITDDGIPYFTMEYIDGKPLTEYCREKKLNLRQRLKLFIDICEAVQYAHQNLVVHRDLKPQNILVTANGKLKLLDFGIARLSDRDVDDSAATQTRPGDRALTPQYAAPEQILGEAVTVSADVYALGIVLFEMLCERRPFQDHENRLRELMTAAEEPSPEPPSKVLSRLNSHSDTVTAMPGSRISRDLDNICLMALRREPDRRYPSVKALQEDVERYLNGRPVSARKPTVGYRTRKFIKRNQRSLIIASIGILLLATTVTLYSVRLAAERDRARLEAEKSDQVSQFLLNIFEVADPYLTNGDTITARTLLQRGAAKVSQELQEQPQVRAAMMATMGSVFLNLGLPEDAAPLIDKSLQFHRQSEPLSADFAEALVLKGDLQLVTGEFEEGSKAFQEAYHLYSQLGEDYRYQALDALAGFGRMLSQQRKSEAAEAVFRDVIKQQKQFLDKNDPRRTGPMTRLASILRHRGDYDEAQKLLEKSLDIRLAHYGPDHMEVSTAHHELGVIFHRRRQLAAAEAQHLKALGIAQRVLGDRHLEVATNYQMLGDLYKDQKRYGESEKMFRRMLDIRIEKLGTDHPLVATSKDFIGRILRRQGKLAEAKPFHLEALELKIKIWGRNHTSTANTINNLAKVYSYSGDHATAEKYYRECLQIYIDQLGPQYPDASTALHNLALCLRDQNKYTEAEPLLRESAMRQEHLVGPNHIRTTNEFHFLGQTQMALGKYLAADSSFRNELQRLTASREPDDWRIARTWRMIGMCQIKLKNLDEAGENLLSSFSILEPQKSEQAEEFRETVEQLLLLARRRGDQQAIKEYQDLLRTLTA